MTEERPKKEMVILAYSFSGPHGSLGKAFQEAKGRRGRWSGAEKIFAVKKVIFYSEQKQDIDEREVNEVYLVFGFYPCKSEDDAKEVAKGNNAFRIGEEKIFVVTEENPWPK